MTRTTPQGQPRGGSPSRRRGDFCGVADSNDCKAWPRLGTPDSRRDTLTYAECFACGEPVCTSCSMKVTWFSFGRRRVGFDCLRTFDRGAEVETHYDRLARLEATRA